MWIAALAVACLAVGIGLGALLTGQSVVALSEVPAAQVARAPEALSASFAEIARRVEPAVVNIDTVAAPAPTADKDNESDEDEKDTPSDNPLLDMLRRRAQRAARGVGSGFIVDPKGLILTNQHVVEGATRITVKLQTGETLRGEVVGVDEETDVAVVRVKPTRDLPSVRLGNSDEVQVGDWVLAIGSPFGLDQTVTAGIISTRERSNEKTGATSFQRFLQTDAAINRGNSGGPLVNMRGEVIGINSQIATTTGDYNGIGFALPSNEVSFVYQQIVSAGKVRRGYLGIFLDSVRAEYARVYGLPEAKGAIVRDVADENGPAVKAGLQTNDIILEIDGRQVSDAQDLINKVAATTVGQTIKVTYMREVGGQLERRTASVVVAERPSRAQLIERDSSVADDEADGARPDAAGAPKSQPAPPAATRPVLGMKVSELTTQVANERRLTGVRGLLVTRVDPAGIAADANLEAGMVIQRVNRRAVTSLADFDKVIESLNPGDAVVMHVVVRVGGRVEPRIVQFTFQ
ncbi:MAG TPA: trypsin-like peptidase domain-containing protein [Pyrinomonadaceae bacterium]|nr:trypsin-like peptidase domain-containing protein [Pyrinomonadaceae bacterium]